jgi:hypothetical protein
MVQVLVNTACMLIATIRHDIWMLCRCSSRSVQYVGYSAACVSCFLDRICCRTVDCSRDSSCVTIPHLRLNSPLVLVAFFSTTFFLIPLLNELFLAFLFHPYTSGLRAIYRCSYLQAGVFGYVYTSELTPHKTHTPFGSSDCKIPHNEFKTSEMGLDVPSPEDDRVVQHANVHSRHLQSYTVRRIRAMV